MLLRALLFGVCAEWLAIVASLTWFLLFGKMEPGETANIIAMVVHVPGVLVAYWLGGAGVENAAVLLTVAFCIQAMLWSVLRFFVLLRRTRREEAKAQQKQPCA